MKQKFCCNCAFFESGNCRHFPIGRSLVTGKMEYKTCYSARYYSECGPSGKCFSFTPGKFIKGDEMNAIDELQEILLAWRRAERETAKAVLTSQLPGEIRELKDAEERALHRLRIFVDSEPWADLHSRIG